MKVMSLDQLDEPKDAQHRHETELVITALHFALEAVLNRTPTAKDWTTAAEALLDNTLSPEELEGDTVSVQTVPGLLWDVGYNIMSSKCTE